MTNETKICIIWARGFDKLCNMCIKWARKSMRNSYKKWARKFDKLCKIIWDAWNVRVRVVEMVG